MAEPQELTEWKTDHDILVALTRDVGHLTRTVETLAISIETKNTDHEHRIRDLEASTERQQGASTTWRWVFSIGLAVAIPAIGWLYAHVYANDSTFDRRVQSAITSTLKNYSLIQH